MRKELPLATDRQIYQTQVGNFRVSTVKLMWIGDNFYETMVFTCDDVGKVTSFQDLYRDRCETLEETKAMHEKAVEKYLKEGDTP